MTSFGSSASQDYDEGDERVNMEIDGEENNANIDMEEDDNDLEEALDVDIEDEYIPDDDDNDDRAGRSAQAELSGANDSEDFSDMVTAHIDNNDQQRVQRHME